MMATLAPNFFLSYSYQLLYILDYRLRFLLKESNVFLEHKLNKLNALWLNRAFFDLICHRKSIIVS